MAPRASPASSCISGQSAQAAIAASKRRYLAQSAARQNGDDFRVGSEPQLGARGAAAGIVRNTIGERVADKARPDAVFPEECLLEGEQCEHHVHGSADFRQAISAPRPDLGARIVQRRDASPVQGELKGEIEIRRVHSHEEIRRVIDKSFDEPLAHAAQLPVTAQRLQQTDHRQPLHGIQDLATRRRHAGTGDSLEARPRITGGDGSNQPGAQKVAGRLSGNDGNAQCRSLVGSPGNRRPPYDGGRRRSLPDDPPR
jgi:hypothetical protein